MNIISFSGIDGSGKSALANKAKAFLNSKGNGAKVIEVYRNSIYISIGRILGYFSAGMKNNIESAQKNSGFKKGLSGIVRRICLFLDIIIFSIRAACFSLCNKTVICDRYFFDILVHYIFLGVLTDSQASFFLKIIPRPRAPILLITDEKTAQAREQDHDDLNYYGKKNELYKKFGKEWNLIMVDSSRPENETWSKIEPVITRIGSSQNKNILMVSRAVEPPWDEASKNLVRDIVSNIGKYDFHILTTRSGSNIDRKNITREEIYSNKVLNFVQKIRLFLFLMRCRSDFDLYHFCFTPEPLSSFIVKSLVNREKSIQNIPYLTDNINMNKVDRIVYAKTVIVNSQHTKNILEKNGVDNAHLVYPSVDTKRFSPDTDGSSLKRSLSIFGRFNVLWPVKFASETEVDVLSSIIYKTCILELGINFIIAARIDGSVNKLRQDRLKDKLNRQKIDSRVAILNKIDDMAFLIAACDMMVYPFFRGFKKKIDIPYVIVEAMASGKPVLISDKEPINEVIREGSGIAIPKDDEQEFAENIALFFKDEELRKKVGAANREIALKYFDLEKNVKKIEQLYESFLCR